MFWILNKKDNTPYICGSVQSASEVTNISANTLYNYFSRDKVLEVNIETYRICKLHVTRARAKEKKISNHK